MSATLFSTLFLWLLLLFVAGALNLGFCYRGLSENSNAKCIQSEMEALLEFKKHLTDPSNRLGSWAVTDVYCCSWYGVSCHKSTGHVLGLHLRSPSYDEDDLENAYSGADGNSEETGLGGKISSVLQNLTHLRYLDLSYNDFRGITIPTFLGSMRSLRYLNLCQAGFGGMIPHQLGSLSNLHYLNLRNFKGYGYGYNPYVEDFSWISGLSSLKFLDLNGVNLSKILIPQDLLNSLPSLQELHLSSCQLPPQQLQLNNVNSSSSLSILYLSGNQFQGPIPDELQNITTLEQLDLSFNQFSSYIPKWLYGFTHLEYLSLAGNILTGKISDDIGNMTSLITLDLSSNTELDLDEGLPVSFKYLCNLKDLYLSNVRVRQDINQVFEILSTPGCASNGLESLRLGGNQLFGNFETTYHYLGRFQNLVLLTLRQTSISGSIPASLGELTSLRSLYLSDNKLNGTLPVSLGKLNRLEELDILENSLEGDVSEAHFQNLTNLQTLVATGNQLKLRVGTNWIPPLQLQQLELGSWHVGPQFPMWIRSLKSLSLLDLSNSGISSSIPAWFWSLSSQFEYFNLSCNQIHGVLPTLSAPPSSWIDLSSNHFHGPLPSLSSDLSALDLSNNLFSGSISSFLCDNMHQEKNMQVLNLRQNLLSGEIPDCWMPWRSLVVINLSDNKFNGTIPDSIGTLNSLQSLRFRNNSLTGEMPLSLRSCTQLVIVDAGENELQGSISRWITRETLSGMIILNFRSNKFSGPFPRKLCHATSLHILDLANNNFSGTIPRCIRNFNEMAIMNESTGILRVWSNDSLLSLETQLIQMKGDMLEYSTNVGFVRSLDLSNNRLSGEIPEEITSLIVLQSLNLSHNILTGRIPIYIGSMKLIESIDLSVNQLYGEIPQSISSLTFLSQLNLSNNRLSGKIPSGAQIQGFDVSSFANNELCGRPLSKNCKENDTTQYPNNTTRRHDDDNRSKVDGFFITMVFGFVVGFWIVVGPLLFNRRWRHMYYQFIGRLEDKIWWRLHRCGLF